MTRAQPIVYVTDPGLTKGGFNIRMGGVVLESHPAVALFPDSFRAVGTADDALVATITMLGDHAVLPRLWDRITLPAIDHGDLEPTMAGAVDAALPWADSQRSGTLDEYEAERLRLAREGLPHGYGSLSRDGGPFAGQFSTITRRYRAAGMPPPGTPIPGVCDTAPGHPHLSTPTPPSEHPDTR